MRGWAGAGGGVMIGTWAACAAAATIAGVDLPETKVVGGRTLELVSCGVRDTFWIDHYAAGLYVPRNGAATAARDPKVPKAVELRIVEARFLPSDIPTKWRGALGEELRSEPMMRVRRAWDRLSDGDEVTFTYLPEQGVRMTLNGREILAVEGHAVIDSILDAWAGKDPLASKLHRLTLKNPC